MTPPQLALTFTQGGALVTGAASGIGRATAQLLAAAGVPTVAADCQPVVAGPNLFPLHLDLGQPQTLAAAWQAAQATSPQPLRYLVNVAGILRSGSGAQVSEADWTELITVNATGPLRLSQLAGAALAAHGGGVIVTVTSNAAHMPRTGIGAYGASKAALHTLMGSLALELAPAGVRVCTVSPGSTATPMQAALQVPLQQVIAGQASDFRLGIPLGRIANPEDVAHSILFLLSDQARHLTLCDLRVDGGASLGL